MNPRKETEKFTRSHEQKDCNILPVRTLHRLHLLHPLPIRCQQSVKSANGLLKKKIGGDRVSLLSEIT
ncbi:MAG: hypothetical protein F6J93_01835 [Oscillatoria sp. SIO1A7]|nr:hypothetical protein [Oscillatoria sp. SIO1A7]